MSEPKAGRMADKCVLVLGAGAIGPGVGNGKAAAYVYAREGARVVCADIARDAAQETVDWIGNELGHEAAAITCDAREPASIVAAVEEAARIAGKLHVVHYNVGISRPGGVDRQSEEDWHDVFRANVDGAFHTAQAAIPLMRRCGGGAFVFISSIAAITASGYSYASYEASKAALNRLSRTIAAAHAHEGIRANIVMPGLIDTPHVAAMIAGKASTATAEALAARRAAAPPMKRQGSPFDVAHAALYLASDEAGYVTGQEIAVDGGLTLLVPPA